MANKTSSLICIKEAHDLTYTSCLIRSGIFAILCTISRMVSAFLSGSCAASSTSNAALNCMKSLALLTKKSRTSSKLFSRAKLSGSSPSGNIQTRTFKPASKIKSIPRRDARRPAGSPSNNTVIFLVSLPISRICSGVRAVPEDETTFLMPR